MKETLDAIYEKGVFRPLKSPQIREGEQVRITVEKAERKTPDESLALAAQVYEGLTEEQIAEIERIMLDRPRTLPQAH